MAGGSAPPPSRTARTLHAFLVASTLIVCIGAIVTARSLGPLPVGGGFAALEGAAMVIGAGECILIALLRSRLPPRAPGQSADEWWGRQIGRAVRLWSLLEFLAVVGAVTLFATRRTTAFALLALLAVAGLLTLSPSRLAGE